MGKLFGTDGIRGVANKELTPKLAFDIAKATAYVLNKELHHNITVLIGKDTRISGDMLEAAMVSGFNSVGVNVKLLGIIPTPAVAYLTRKYEADIGVVISASHNSYEFNGIKIFNNKGTKLLETIEKEIEDEIEYECKLAQPAINEKIGTYEFCENAIQDYIDFIVSTVKDIKSNLKIGLDCANGATSKCAENVFKHFGFDVTVIHNEPNGININDNCGSTHIDSLKELVKSKKLDVGFAFDGDGDRLLAVNNEGEEVDGDQIMAICAKYLKEKNALLKDTIVVTIMSNLGVSIFADQNNIKTVKTKVGDKYVLEEMMNSGYNFGGEQSGHIIFKDFNTTGDGIITALQVINIIVTTNKSLKELSNIISIFPQVVVNAKIDNDKKHEYIDDIEITKEIKKLEDEFENDGRVLIRPSGTEPLIRVMIEGKDKEYISKRANELAKMIEKKYQ